MAAQTPGKLVIVSGPSGSGKTTLLAKVMDQCPLPLAESVSATTRQPRSGEIDGKDYYFLSPEEFAERRERGDFLECFEVYGRDCWYGTLKSEVDPRLAVGEWVVLEIDVQGTEAVLEKYPEAITIFVRPRSIEDLEGRLRRRGSETEADLQQRLDGARREWQCAANYRYQVINEDVQQAVDEMCRILIECGG